MKSSAVRGTKVQASLGCATDHEREGNRESMVMIIAEMHDNEVLTLKRDTSCSQAGTTVES